MNHKVILPPLVKEKMKKRMFSVHFYEDKNIYLASVGLVMAEGETQESAISALETKLNTLEQK